jgi:hypothetical protein
MRTEQVEIYSDATNAAVMRHPGRRFPGVLVQGDTLRGLVNQLAGIIECAEDLDEDSRGELDDVYEKLEGLLTHYETTLVAHGFDPQSPSKRG